MSHVLRKIYIHFFGILISLDRTAQLTVRYFSMSNNCFKTIMITYHCFLVKCVSTEAELLSVKPTLAHERYNYRKSDGAVQVNN